MNSGVPGGSHPPHRAGASKRTACHSAVFGLMSVKWRFCPPIPTSATTQRAAVVGAEIVRLNTRSGAVSTTLRCSGVAVMVARAVSGVGKEPEPPVMTTDGRVDPLLWNSERDTIVSKGSTAHTQVDSVGVTVGEGRLLESVLLVHPVLDADGENAVCDVSEEVRDNTIVFVGLDERDADAAVIQHDAVLECDVTTVGESDKEEVVDVLRDCVGECEALRDSVSWVREPIVRKGGECVVVPLPHELSVRTSEGDIDLVTEIVDKDVELVGVTMLPRRQYDGHVLPPVPLHTAALLPKTS